MSTPLPGGASHPRRRCASSGPSTVLLVLIAFGFTGWMITQSFTPIAAVATTSAVMAMTIALTRSTLIAFRPFSARFGVLPPSDPPVIWREGER